MRWWWTSSSISLLVATSAAERPPPTPNNNEKALGLSIKINQEEEDEEALWQQGHRL
jgi:hypothetical protein